jgi:hypothetical protein
MLARASFCCAVACLLVLGSAEQSWAAGRDVWVHSNGTFTNTRGNTWVEHVGAAIYNFREVRRTDSSVELYDKSRACTVRLTRHTCLVKFGSGGFDKYYDGKWVR